MNENNKTVDEFFEGLPSEDKAEADIFSEPEKAIEKEPDPEQVPDSIKNRAHRRLEDKLQRERESNIALTERIKAMSEVNRVSTEKPQIDKRLLTLYGTDERGLAAAEITNDILRDAIREAKEETMKEFETREAKTTEATKQFESFIDNELESLEDDYGVDLTSDAPAARKARREFLEMVMDVSPKEDGVVTAYADFGSTYQLYQLRKNSEKPSASRQKDLADRSMQKGGVVNNDKATQDATASWLRQNGIRI